MVRNPGLVSLYFSYKPTQTLAINYSLRVVTIFGIIDLVHETADRVGVVDYKADSTRCAQPEYRKQLSAYDHVLAE